MTEQEQKETLVATDTRIAELKAQVALGKDLESLHEDERFQRVILGAYLDDEAERLFGLLSNPSYFKRDQLQNTMDRLTAIRSVKEWFGVKLQEAQAAPEQIDSENEFRNETTAVKTSIDVEIID